MKTRLLFVLTLCIFQVSFSQERKYPYTTTMQLRNCSKEMRVVTFEEQIGFFWNWVYGQTKLETTKMLHFSDQYKVDSNYLRRKINEVRKSLPPKFWTFPMGEEWFDNEPNQDSIWFIQLFVQIEKTGKVKIFSAYKIIFEGNDARESEQRQNPRIKDIEFILDKQRLLALESKLKISPKSK